MLMIEMCFNLGFTTFRSPKSFLAPQFSCHVKVPMIKILLGNSAADGEIYVILSSPRSTSLIHTNPATMLQKGQYTYAAKFKRFLYP